MKKILSNLDTIIRMITPKLVTILINAIRGGSRVILRSTVQLLRANMLTRIISCLTILLMDIIDLSRRRISKIQFIRNLVLSGLLILFGTIGWNIGASWFAIEILGGLIGAAVMSMASNSLFDRLIEIFIKSDKQCMLQVVNDCLADYPESERVAFTKQLSPGQLKKMYASKDREQFVLEFINDLKNKED
ncbi:MAG: hypothetical protein FWE14_11140 [Lachnospiraceae bacterium]|nr:hypothetical protein [Lachnospiraceae bacterium]